MFVGNFLAPAVFIMVSTRYTLRPGDAVVPNPNLLTTAAERHRMWSHDAVEQYLEQVREQIDRICMSREDDASRVWRAKRSYDEFNLELEMMCQEEEALFHTNALKRRREDHAARVRKVVETNANVEYVKELKRIKVFQTTRMLNASKNTNALLDRLDSLRNRLVGARPGIPRASLYRLRNQPGLAPTMPKMQAHTLASGSEFQQPQAPAQPRPPHWPPPRSPRPPNHPPPRCPRPPKHPPPRCPRPPTLPPPRSNSAGD